MNLHYTGIDAIYESIRKVLHKIFKRIDRCILVVYRTENKVKTVQCRQNCEESDAASNNLTPDVRKINHNSERFNLLNAKE